MQTDRLPQHGGATFGASLAFVISALAFGCSSGPVDPFHIDGTYSGQSETYREVTLEIDRTVEFTRFGGRLATGDSSRI